MGKPKNRESGSGTFSAISGNPALEDLIKSINEALMVVESDWGRVLYVSAAFERLWGFDPTRLANGRALLDHIHPEDLSRAWVFMQQCQFGLPDQREKIEVRIMRPDKTSCWISMKVNSMLSSKRRRFALVMEDITENVELRKSLKQTQFAMDAAHEAVFWFDTQGKFTYVNESACKLLKSTADALLKQTVFSVGLFADSSEIDAACEKLEREGRVLDEVSLDGAEFGHIDVELSLKEYEYEGVPFYCVFVRNVTERKAAERLYRLTQYAVDHSSDSVFWCDNDLQLLNVNKTGCQSLGGDRETIIKLHVDDIDPELGKQAREFLASADRSASSSFFVTETRHRRLDGTQYPVEVQFNHIELEGYSTNCIYARNISERVQREDKIRFQEHEIAHMNRLSSMGEMGAALAHELNQPLAAVCNYAAVLTAYARTKNFDTEVSEVIDLITNQTMRAGDVVRRMSSYIKDSGTERRPVNVNSLVSESVKFLEPQIRLHRIRLDLHLLDSLPTVELDAVQIQQVLVNLIRNACDSLDDVHDRERVVDVITRMEDDSESVVIEIRDNGAGFGHADLGSIFDPFYSSKDGGMGMGLAISQSIIRSHQGELTALGLEPGASFRVNLPLEVSETPAATSQTST